MAEQLGRCEDFDSPHEYSGMTCKNWQPEAAPAPQAELTVEFSKPNLDNVDFYAPAGMVIPGAAPAETAGPNIELCQNCHRENPVWFAPNDVWNAVVTEVSGILCPICFIDRAERQGYVCTAWQLIPERLETAYP